MDDLDILILNALQEDGRTPFTQIAKKAGVAESTIRSRYTSLAERGIVQTIAVVDPFSLGHNAPALIGIFAEPGKVHAVAGALEKLAEISYLVLTLGRYDLVVEVFCRDREHLTDLITNQIQLISGIRGTETLVIGKIFKLSFFWKFESDSQIGWGKIC
ncbi:MAG: Lrp/AsnC family transcriptional regulator [Chloroflexi bacterium]|jgi:Lrp/AsnC family transcriptional regulator, regulator for asnA, asnC and gidA|nr:Lrp/AsnC family transcriptional regulator [Chloroflexota bacterium]